MPRDRRRIRVSSVPENLYRLMELNIAQQQHGGRRRPMHFLPAIELRRGRYAEGG